MTTPLEPVVAGCAWPIDETCLTGWEDIDPDVQDRSILFASATLRRLTGYRVGGCPITVRPCKRGCADMTLTPSYYDMLRMGGAGVSSFWPHLDERGLWVNSCGCNSNCSCVALCEIELPEPVGRVDSVLIDGEEVTDYRVDGNWLVWTGEDDCPWPACQDLTVANDAVGAFSVTYLNGYPVDTLGAYAAGTLANEFAKACSGGKCRLPSGVTSIARQGISMEIATGAFPGGVTGIREVDTFLSLWNPEGLRQPTQVWTPDQRTPRVVSG